ncbi:hypothetical protein KGP36_04955 [Patescibacteria group bacterium]|nr:hypothetical protein [Patescibacteria group bacterium]
MIIKAFNGIPIPTEYQRDARLMQAYLRGFRDAKASKQTRFRTVKTVVDSRRYEYYKRGNYPQPKKPWEMTPQDRIEEQRKMDPEFEAVMGYVPNLPRSFGPPPPPQRGGSVDSFDDDLRGQFDTVILMRLARKRIIGRS